MLRYSSALREKLAVLGIAGSFVLSPAILSQVMAEEIRTDAEQTDRIVEEDASAPVDSDGTLAGDGEGKVDSMTSAAIPAAGAAVDFFVYEQEDDQVLANRYLGRAVYNDAMEKVGSVNDLVFTKEGGIEAAVIGVGGFLGLGEKNVAVRFDAISIIENPETGDIELRISATEDQLAEAPTFKTMAMKLAEIRAEEAARAARQERAGTSTGPLAPKE
jgi:sporulation protein YlmC with PRC-barrel domain